MRTIIMLITESVIALTVLPIYPQTITADKLEIFMKTKNTSGAKITFETACQNSPVWDNFGYITTQSKFTDPIDLVIEGDYSGTEKGWDSSDDTDPDMPRLGRTELYGSYQSYIISVANKSATLTVDCFGNSFLGDVYIMYDYSADKFYDDGTSNEITNINLYDAPEYLQPTSPQNFHCTNPTAYGQHPQFAWSAPEEPEDVTFKYKIYRKDGAYSYALVASDFNDLSWTDPEINIEPKSIGIQFTYYAKAYTDQSPDSDPSESASIYGLYVQKSLPEYAAYDCSTVVSNCLPIIFNLDAYPNPFNPSTTIRYALPTASHVTLKVFNLRGELVKILVDGNRAANRYQVVWNGANESGAKVAAGIYLYQLKTDNYSQIKRMIFIK